MQWPTYGRSSKCRLVFFNQYPPKKSQLTNTKIGSITGCVLIGGLETGWYESAEVGGIAYRPKRTRLNFLCIDRNSSSEM